MRCDLCCLIRCCWCGVRQDCSGKPGIQCSCSVLKRILCRYGCRAMTNCVILFQKQIFCDRCAFCFISVITLGIFCFCTGYTEKQKTKYLSLITPVLSFCLINAFSTYEVQIPPETGFFQSNVLASEGKISVCLPQTLGTSIGL